MKRPTPEEIYLTTLACLNVEDREDKWARIVKEYTDPKRTYHNMKHIELVVKRIQDIVTKPPLPNEAMIFNDLGVSNYSAMYLAAIYHDIIYHPGMSYNELGSAAAAVADLGMGITPQDPMWEFMIMISRAINSTNHVAYSDLPYINAALVDADLYGLATPSYAVNSILIRNEFCDFTDEQWATGRKAFLRGMLPRQKGEDRPELFPHIFHLDGPDATRDELDAKARANMQSELDLLLISDGEQGTVSS